jgi:hypothetical protein
VHQVGHYPESHQDAARSTKHKSTTGNYYRLAEVRRCYAIDVNVLKTKVIGMSRLPFPIKIMIHQKQLENVEYFNYMGSLIKQVM